MLKENPFDENDPISIHPFRKMEIARDNNGKEYTYERFNWRKLEMHCGSDTIILEHNKDINKRMKLKTDMGWYYPMYLQLNFSPITIQTLTPREIHEEALKLIDEYREFKKLMEEVAE